jgi:hypothetical protein
LQGEGPLLTIAEISVSLAGFSSVVIALRGSGPDAWSPQDRFGLGNVLGASVGTLVGSLLPFPLAYLGWSSGTVWRVVDAILGLVILGAVGFLAFSAAKGSVSPRTPRLFWLFAGSGFLVAGLLLASAGGLIFARGPSLLLFGLIWALVAAFAQLATFVLATWSGSS